MRIVLFVLLAIISLSCNSLKRVNTFNSVNACSYLDTSIVVINIGELDRQGIMNVIDYVAKRNPKVIALNVILKDTSSIDFILSNTLKSFNKIVLLNNTHNVLNERFEFVQNGVDEYLSVDQFGLVRWINLNIDYNNRTYPTFPYSILKYSNPNIFNEYANDTTAIKFTYNGGYYCYNSVDHRQLDEIKDEIFTDKIVLLGYAGINQFAFENKVESDIDTHMTPLESGLFSHKFEYMYTTYILANALSYIINNSVQH